MNANENRTNSLWAVAALIGMGLFVAVAGAQTYDVLKEFYPHSDPQAGLIQGTDGNLYGTTAGGGGNGCLLCGTIFEIDTSGTAFTTLHGFVGSDGRSPYASVIQATDGNLYGTTVSGGAGGCTGGFVIIGCGTIFKIDTNGSMFTTLYSFGGGDGENPRRLIQGTDGNLYGVTLWGGASDLGTIFRIGIDGSAFTTLHDFVGGDGANPMAGLIQGTDGSLYGTTATGGAANCTPLFLAPGCGTIFKIDTNGSTFSTLHSFVISDGAQPLDLIVGSDGSLYGTTTAGGAGGCTDPIQNPGCGTIFKVDASGSTFTTLHSFMSSDGAFPYARVVQGADGSLYGTTFGGGAGGCPLYGGCGTVFRTDTDGATLTTLHSFNSADGEAPAAALVQAVDGNFYGTAQGGPTGGGVVFRLSPDCFWDVPSTDPFYADICIIAADGITAGCGFGNYCRDAAALRKQMAVFVLKAREGSSYTPPPAEGIFTDVPASDPFAPWIEELYHRGVVAGCGDGTTYCPEDPVLRQQMAVFLLKTLLGSDYTPPACVGIFGDVPCASPFAVWIEDLYTRSIAAGCGGGNYCPGNPTTRGQLAVFLAKTFGLD